MPTSESVDPLLDVNQAAERFGTSVWFLRTLIKQRRIEYVKLGRHVRIRQSVIDAMIDAGTVQPRRPAA